MSDCELKLCRLYDGRGRLRVGPGGRLTLCVEDPIRMECSLAEHLLQDMARAHQLPAANTATGQLGGGQTSVENVVRDYLAWAAVSVKVYFEDYNIRAVRLHELIVSATVSCVMPYQSELTTVDGRSVVALQMKFDGNKPQLGANFLVGIPWDLRSWDRVRASAVYPMPITDLPNCSDPASNIVVVPSAKNNCQSTPAPVCCSSADTCPLLRLLPSATQHQQHQEISGSLAHQGGYTTQDPAWSSAAIHDNSSSPVGLRLSSSSSPPFDQSGDRLTAATIAIDHAFAAVSAQNKKQRLITRPLSSRTQPEISAPSLDSGLGSSESSSRCSSSGGDLDKNSASQPIIIGITQSTTVETSQLRRHTTPPPMSAAAEEQTTSTSENATTEQDYYYQFYNWSPTTTTAGSCSWTAMSSSVWRPDGEDLSWIATSTSAAYSGDDAHMKDELEIHETDSATAQSTLGAGISASPEGSDTERDCFDNLQPSDLGHNRCNSVNDDSYRHCDLLRSNKTTTISEQATASLRSVEGYSMSAQDGESSWQSPPEHYYGAHGYSYVPGDERQVSKRDSSLSSASDAQQQVHHDAAQHDWRVGMEAQSSSWTLPMSNARESWRRQPQRSKAQWSKKPSGDQDRSTENGESKQARQQNAGDADSIELPVALLMQLRQGVPHALQALRLYLRKHGFCLDSLRSVGTRNI